MTQTEKRAYQGEAGLTDGLPAALAQRAQGILEHLSDVDVDDAAFERYLRREAVYCEDSHRERLTREEVALLGERVLDAARAGQGGWELLALFFVCFEWYHRFETSTNERRDQWQRLLDGTREQLGSFSLFAYAESLYADACHDRARARACARRAHEAAPGHVGFWNNYAELILGDDESALLGRESGEPRELTDAERETLVQLEAGFRAFPAQGHHPIYFHTLGRIAACLGRASDARQAFAHAMALENDIYERDAGTSGATTLYVSEVSEILDSESTARAISSLRLGQAQSDAARRSARELDEKLARVEEQVDSQRTSMLEFLGFFAGIMSFIIVSVQIGDGATVPQRAGLIVVMLGALLVAFGAFSAFIERPGRDGKRHLGRSAGMVIAGGIILAGALAALATMGA